jgi:hypothetical protein
VIWLLVSLFAVVAAALAMRIIRTRQLGQLGQPTAPVPAPPPLQGGPPDESWLRRPRPGDIWLTAEGERCLVVRTYPETVDVLPMPGDRPENTARLLPDAAFATRVGQVDAELWTEVQKGHRTGYAA